MRRNIAIVLTLILCLNSGIVLAHGATYKVERIGENTVSIIVNAGPEQTNGIEIRSYTVRGGNTININYGYSKDGALSDTMNIDTRTILFPARILLTNVDEENAAVFPDVAGIRNEEYVRHLHDAGIIDGRPDGTFRPYDSITRAEFVTLITKALGIDEQAMDTQTHQFNDINNHWAKERIVVAAKNNIVNGLPDGSFKPDNPVSVSEAGAIVCRAFAIANNNQGSYEKLNANHWAHEYMKTLFNAEILEKNDEISINFDENAPINRADCAMIISRSLMVRDGI